VVSKLPYFAWCVAEENMTVYADIIQNSKRCKNRYMCLRCSEGSQINTKKCKLCAGEEILMLTESIPHKMLKDFGIKFKRKFKMRALECKYKSFCNETGTVELSPETAWKIYLEESRLVTKWGLKAD